MFTYGNMLLQKVEHENLALLQALKAESWQYVHQTLFINKLDQERWFENLDSAPSSPRNLALMVSWIGDNKSDIAHNTKIGCFLMSIDWISRRADISWSLFKEYRGMGLGKEFAKANTTFCFTILNLHRLDAEVLETNIASQKCLEYIGWRKEGVKRQAIYKCGRYVDSIIFGILSSDWVEYG